VARDEQEEEAAGDRPETAKVSLERRLELTAMLDEL
jgi:hypothetical protein